MQCRNCQATVEQHEGYTPWCPACDWNVDPEGQQVPGGFLDRRYHALGQKNGLKLFESLATTPVDQLQPRRNWTNALAFVLALLVHVSSLAFAVLGIWLIWVDWPNIILIIIGCVVIGFAWLLKPSLGQVPKSTLSREEFPALYGVVDRVADALGGRRVNHIVADGEFNAFYGQFGLNRTPVLGLGVPLWIAMTPEERLAVISHELAHGVNGDPNRGVFVGSAVEALLEWVDFLRPAYSQDIDHPMGVADVVTHYLLWLLSWPVAGLAWLLLHLTWQGSQRAEYLADYLATTACGTQNMVNSLHKLACAEYLRPVFLRHVYSPDQSGAAVMKVFEQRIANMPASEWERIRRKNVRENAQLDSTHPPTLFRIKFLEFRPVDSPAVSLTQDEILAMDREFERLIEPVGSRMINEFLDN